jgi:tetraprenyl-beta-curcumene synthase
VYTPAPPAQPTDDHPLSDEDAYASARLSARQIWILILATARELTWGLLTVAHEVRQWRRRSRAIPSPWIREEALKASAEQRSHIDGAALFSILPRHRSRHLLRLLVSYEIIWDFLDNVNEHTQNAGVASGLRLHQALIDALDPNREIGAFYTHHPSDEDAGYLRQLTFTCRETYTQLSSHGMTQKVITRESTRALVCAINHDPHPNRRNQALEDWATAEFPKGHEAQWFELTAAASTNITIYALLALASEPACSRDLIAQTAASYFPWISVLTAMLDSYVDQAEDADINAHNYLSHYETPAAAIKRLCALIERCLREANSLQHGERHVVISCSMFAMYLTKDCARKPPMRQTTNRLLQAGGGLTHLLTPMLTLWRKIHGLHNI